MRRLLILGSLFCLFAATNTWAQFNIENPTANTTQSGISVVSGWICNATKVEVVIDNFGGVPIPHGIERPDAQTLCGGRMNTGFGGLINWNELGDGPHAVKIIADGKQIANIPVIVVTLGTNFLRGANQTLSTGFAGCLVTLQWRESTQQFAFTKTELCYRPLLGRWEFVTKKPGGNELNHYTLTTIETRVSASTGEEAEVVTGTDLDHGGLVLLARVKDLIATPLPYDFAVASLLSSRCELLIFKQTGPGSVQGIGTSFPADPVYGCARYPSPAPGEYPMTGTRTAAAVSVQEELSMSPSPLPSGNGVETSINSEILGELSNRVFELVPRQ